jgi:hypothetical protein
MDEYMLTTIDNPINPFNDFDEWYNYDERILGYHTCSVLAKECKTSFEFSETQQEQDINEAIDRICKRNVLGVYRRIRPDGTIYTPKE